MERPRLHQYLAQAEQHVVRGELALRKQRALIARLEKDGHNTMEAKLLLRQFEQLQALHVADRDRLRDQLSSMKA